MEALFSCLGDPMISEWILASKLGCLLESLEIYWEVGSLGFIRLLFLRNFHGDFSNSRAFREVCVLVVFVSFSLLKPLSRDYFQMGFGRSGFRARVRGVIVILLGSFPRCQSRYWRRNWGVIWSP